MALLGDERQRECSRGMNEAVSADHLDRALGDRCSGRACEMARAAIIAGQPGGRAVVVVGCRLLHIALFGPGAARSAVVRVLRTGLLGRPSGRKRWRGRMRSVLAERHSERRKTLQRKP